MPTNKNEGGSFWPKWNENKLFTVLLSILIVYAIVWLFGQIRYDDKAYRFIGKQDVRDSISIEADGKVNGAPDVAVIDVGFLTQQKEVATAQVENTKKMNGLIEKIKALSIEPKDMQTLNYSIYPQYDYPEGKQVLQGYQVSQTLRVKVRDMNKINTILAAAGENGANQVSGVSFIIDDPEKLKQEARDKALQIAFEKAQTLAAKTGVRLGKMVYYNEYTPDAGVMMKDYASSYGIGGPMPAEAPAPQIEPGNMEVIVNVNLGFEIL